MPHCSAKKKMLQMVERNCGGGEGCVCACACVCVCGKSTHKTYPWRSFKKRWALTGFRGDLGGQARGRGPMSTIWCLGHCQC